LTEIGRCEPSALAVTKEIFNRAARAVDPAELDAAAKDFARCLRGAGRDGAAAFAQKKLSPWVELFPERTET
jgi:isohexenylglutaconyl-CoA hydratase